MSHHNDICKECYESINNCECYKHKPRADNKPTNRKFQKSVYKRKDELDEIVSKRTRTNKKRDSD